MLPFAAALLAALALPALAQEMPREKAKRQEMQRGQGPQRGRIMEVDPERRTVILTVGERTVVLKVMDRTELRGARGETLEERLRSFAFGDEVLFRATQRDGAEVLMGMMKASPGGEGPVSPEHGSLQPLDELGAGDYQGHAGGFYPGGRNTRPPEHEAAGRKLAAALRPLDAQGNAHPSGRIVLLSVGISNAAQASQGFDEALAAYAGRNPRLLFVNGAGGISPQAIRNPTDSELGTRYWTDVARRLHKAGATRAQVQAVWIKIAWPGPKEGFPGYAKRLQGELAKLVQVVAEQFPNVKLAYLSSRSYGGHATISLNPEPYAYESAFAVKWLIEEQIEGETELNFDPAKGPVKAPWLSWGPYLWANGLRPRASDGLTWQKGDFADDGIHLSPEGQRKAGRVMVEFFRSDSTSAGWFNRP